MAARKSSSVSSTRRQGRSSTGEESSEYESAGRSTRRASGADISSLSQMFSNPAVRYVAGGIATAVLTKLAANIQDKYPQISQFLREGIESMEGRLSEFNGGQSVASNTGSSTRSRRSAAAGMGTH